MWLGCAPSALARRECRSNLGADGVIWRAIASVGATRCLCKAVSLASPWPPVRSTSPIFASANRIAVETAAAREGPEGAVVERLGRDGVLRRRPAQLLTSKMRGAGPITKRVSWDSERARSVLCRLAC